jgi:hypothetical protein
MGANHAKVKNKIKIKDKKCNSILELIALTPNKHLYLI